MMRAMVMTMAAMVLGGVGACTSSSDEKNYKMLEDDRPMFESEHKPLGRASLIEARFASLEDDTTVTVSADDAPPPTGGQREPVLPTAFTYRSQWEPVVIGPADGRTAHQPWYFNDCPIGQSHIQPANPEAAFEQYVDDGPGTVFTADNAKAAATQPLKAGLDLLLLPVRAILTPPWTTVHTPDYAAK